MGQSQSETISYSVDAELEEDGYTPLELGHLTAAELATIRRVLEDQRALEEAEAERLKKLEEDLEETWMAPPDSPIKGQPSYLCPQGEQAVCKFCKKKSECMNMQYYYPAAPKKEHLKVCADCFKLHDINVSSGGWYHGYDCSRALQLCNWLLDNLAETVPSTELPEMHNSLDYDRKQLSSDNLEGLAPRREASLTRKERTLPEVAHLEGPEFRGRLEVHAVYVKFKKTRCVNLAVAKAYDLTQDEDELGGSLYIQACLLPERKKDTDVQVSRPAMFHNGRVEWDQLFSWPDIPKKELKNFQAELSVWSSHPLQLIGVVKVPFAFLSNKKETEPHVYDLFFNAQKQLMQLVYSVPVLDDFSEEVVKDGDDSALASSGDLQMDIPARYHRRSTNTLAELAAAKHLNRIASLSTATGDPSESINVVTPFTSETDDTADERAGPEGLTYYNPGQFSFDTPRNSESFTAASFGGLATPTPPVNVDEQEDESKIGRIMITDSNGDVVEEDVYSVPHHRAKLSAARVESTAESTLMALATNSPSGDEVAKVNETDAEGVVDTEDEMFRSPSPIESIGSSPENSIPEADRAFAQKMPPPPSTSSVETPRTKNPYENLMAGDSVESLGKPLSYTPKAGVAGSLDQKLAATAMDKLPLALGGQIQLTLHEVRHNELHINVIQGSSIPARSSSGLYCKAYANAFGKRMKSKTKTVESSSEPVFNEEIVINTPNTSDLEVMVWETHGRVGRHTMLCSAVIHLKELRFSEPLTAWYPLNVNGSSPEHLGKPSGPLRKSNSLTSWVFNQMS